VKAIYNELEENFFVQLKKITNEIRTDLSSLEKELLQLI
jgi:hypothetical protein